MTSPDDYPDEMQAFPFDDRGADAVFGACPGADCVPEALRDLADLVSVARRTGSSDELVGEDVIVAQIAAAIGEPAALPQGDADERTRVLTKLHTAKLATAVTAVLVFGATAAAAATGSLPSPVQNSVASGLSGVGISVPAHHKAAHHKIELAVEHTTPAGPAVDPQHDGRKRKGHKIEKKLANGMSGAFGTVASVNGVAVAGTCGTAGGTGPFTLTFDNQTFTVNAGPTTIFVAKGVTIPTFANVCVGDLAAAKGTVSGTTVTATKVFVSPPPPPHVPTGAAGVVASVNGVTTAATCGTAGTGTFTLTSFKSRTFTVNVDSSTTYTEKTVTSPTFANVCVGEFVGAKGTVTGTTVAAASVFITPVRHEYDPMKHHGAFGTVASVNGMTVAGTCGVSGATGTFTLTGFKGMTFTVTVDTSTKFFDPGVMTASFANICVGAKAGAIGDGTGSTIAATTAFVLPEPTGTGDGGIHSKKGHDGHDSSKSPGFFFHGPQHAGDPGKGNPGKGHEHHA